MKKVFLMMQNISRSILLYGAVILTIFTGCHRSDSEEITTPENPVRMKYKNLGDVEVAFQKAFPCDVDDDGKNDFYISSELIGKPSEQSDYHSYFFLGAFNTNSLVNSNEETPVLNLGDKIGKNIYPDHNWYNGNQITLAEKVIPLNGNEHWIRNWKDASHQYLAFSIKKNGKLYYGWLELTFSKNTETVILHRSAVAEEADKTVIAGK